MQGFAASAFAAISVVLSASVLMPGPHLSIGQETQAKLAEARTSPASYSLLPAVPYGNPGGVELVADMYLPSGKGPFPAVLFIHGGGWSSGDRTQLRRQAAYMAERGMVGMAIEYRLAPAHAFPSALEDSREALRWLRQHAATYKIDPAHIGAVGSSAGGHLVSMLGVESAGQPTSATSVQAVVVLNGIFDLEAVPATEMISGLLGKPCAQAIDTCREASPLITSGQARRPFS